VSKPPFLQFEGPDESEMTTEARAVMRTVTKHNWIGRAVMAAVVIALTAFLLYRFGDGGLVYTEVAASATATP
jgi:hypothetical protein